MFPHSFSFSQLFSFFFWSLFGLASLSVVSFFSFFFQFSFKALIPLPPFLAAFPLPSWIAWGFPVWRRVVLQWGQLCLIFGRSRCPFWTHVLTALNFLVAVLTCPAHTSRLVGPDACASSLIRPFPRVPPFGGRGSGGLVVGRVGGCAWGLWGLPLGGFPLFFLCSSFFLFLLSLFSVPPGCLAPFVFSLPFPFPFSCRFFSWLCSVLGLFALPRLSPCRLAFPSALRFAFFFVSNVRIAAGPLA